MPAACASCHGVDALGGRSDGADRSSYQRISKPTVPAVSSKVSPVVSSAPTNHCSRPLDGRSGRSGTSEKFTWHRKNIGISS